MFYATAEPVRRLAPFAQVKDETRIAHGFATEASWRHTCTAEESFDAVQCGHDWTGPFAKDDDDSL